MSMRMNVPSSPARSTSRATFAYAVSSSKDRPRCVSLRATFAFSFSATSRSTICSYSAVTAAAPSAFGIASPRSVVFAYRPASFSLRRTATHESSVSPATKRAAPMRRPWRWTRCCRRELSAACRMAARERVETVVRRSVKRCRDYRPRASAYPSPALAIRVVLAEDNYLVREGMRQLLAAEADIEVIAVCEDSARLARRDRDGAP